MKNLNVHAKRIIVGILTHVFVRTANIQKSISDASVIVYDDIISVMDCYGYINFVPTKMTNTIATNVTQKVRDCYILYRVSLAIMLLLIITITCYRYAKQKGIDALTI